MVLTKSPAGVYPMAFSELKGTLFQDVVSWELSWKTIALSNDDRPARLVLNIQTGFTCFAKALPWGIDFERLLASDARYILRRGLVFNIQHETFSVTLYSIFTLTGESTVPPLFLVFFFNGSTMIFTAFLCIRLTLRSILRI